MDSAAPPDALPLPVRRYLANALPQAVPSPWRVRLQQHGTLRTGTGSQRWMPFDATQCVSPGAAGFVWNAKVRAAPLLHLRVLDSLADGRGEGRVLLLSLLLVTRDGGTPEMNSGALHRFLAEAVWYPWALLPGERLRWTPIDARSALATLSAHGTTVSLEFRFSPAGEVTGIYTPARWGSFRGHYEQRAWEGHFFEYERRHGVLVPLRAEVGWYEGGALGLVWEGRIAEIAFDAGPAA
jgi:hypothetical protein